MEESAEPRHGASAQGERKGQEKSLDPEQFAVSGAQLRRLFEQAPGFMAVLRGPNHVFTLANAAYYQLVGHRDIIGRPLVEAIPEIREQQFLGMLDRAFRSGETIVGHDMRALLQREPGGELEERFVHFVFQPLLDNEGGVESIFVQGIDTTDRKRAELALRASEERYRTLFESIDEGFCVIEVLFDRSGAPCDYRFIEVNPAFAQQSGLVNAIGRTMRELSPTHESHWFDIYGRVAMTGEPARFESEAEALGRWFDVYAFRVGAPETRRVAVLFNDITVRKRSEHALKDADRRKDEFIATLAHELRNPLAPIRNAVQFMALKGLGDAALEKAREIIDRQLQHLVRLVGDLLEVSRITRGLIELQKQTVSLERVVSDAVDSTQSVVESAGHALSVQLPPDPVFMEVDPTRISQILSNLLNNAARYTPAGGRIELSASVESGNVSICIRDNGIGISEAKLDYIFEPFSQGDRMDLRAASGLGIGLSLARQLARLHGGDIDARSAGEGRGSEFILRLPVCPLAQAEAVFDTGLPLPDPDAARASRRILVVDDNADAADTLAVNLQLDGHMTRTAYDGPAALQAMKSFAPEIVLLDIGMPELDGYEVARRIRSLPGGDDVRIVALTGWGQEQDKRRAMEVGFDEHLTKPVDPRVLTSVIRAGSRPAQENAPPGEFTPQGRSH